MKGYRYFATIEGIAAGAVGVDELPATGQPGQAVTIRSTGVTYFWTVEWQWWIRAGWAGHETFHGRVDGDVVPENETPAWIQTVNGDASITTDGLEVTLDGGSDDAYQSNARLAHAETTAVHLLAGYLEVPFHQGHAQGLWFEVRTGQYRIGLDARATGNYGILGHNDLGVSFGVRRYIELVATPTRILVFFDHEATPTGDEVPNIALGAQSYYLGDGHSGGTSVSKVSRYRCGILTGAPIGALETDPGFAEQHKWCYPELPLFADHTYSTGLAEPPEGGGAQWDPVELTASVGSFRLYFRPDVGPLNWFQVATQAIATIDIGTENVLDKIATIVVLNFTNQVSGIEAGDVLYVDRETWLVLEAQPASRQISISRGYAGSRPESHANAANVFRQPPALTGRRVTVYEVDEAAQNATDRVVALRGFLAGEMISGPVWPALEATERLTQYLLNAKQNGVDLNPGNKTASNVTLPGGMLPVGGRRGDPNGGYWLIQDSGVVFSATWYAETAELEAHWNIQQGDIIDPGNVDDGFYFGKVEENDEGTETERPKTYWRILFSAADQAHPPFGRIHIGTDQFEASDDPLVILLNILLSLDGTNYDPNDTYSYDLGAIDETGTEPGGLYPTFAIGVDRELVDVPAFERESQELGGVHASRFWLGGANDKSLEDVIADLARPIGLSIGTTEQGIWRPLRWKDPETSSVPRIDERHISYDRFVTEYSLQVLSRAIDSLILYCDPRPNGTEGANRVLIEEVSARRWYPEGTGAEVEFSLAPYNVEDLISEFSPDQQRAIHKTAMYHFLAARLTRLATRLSVIRIPLTLLGFDLKLQPGDHVEIHDLAIRNPLTGKFLEPGDPPLLGQVLGNEDPSWLMRTNSLRVALTDVVGPSARISAAAVVDDVADWPTGAEMLPHEYSDPDGDLTDTEHFQVGWAVVLCDRYLRPKSNIDGTHITYVSLVNPPNELEFDPPFRDDGGGLVAAATGDIIVFAYYDQAIAAQKAEWAHSAEGGGDGEYPRLGAADEPPYFWGN